MGSYKKVCEYCKKEFIAKDSRVKYCSDECRYNSRMNNKKSIHKICEYCGKEFIAHSNKAKYCSVKCKSNATDNRLHGKIQQKTWICPKCGKHIDRDYNAALNILDEGLNILDEGLKQIL